MSGAEGQIESTPTTAFGKYQLFASLGRGGMADVFLSVARGQMGFNKLAVIKRLRQALAEEAAFRNMFLDEARLAARLNHPNIVHTYEVGEQNGVYFIAMEYLEGQSLNKVLKEALRRNVALETEFAVRVIADALSGLHHAHELRDYDGRPLSIIHRDISPHNIFVTYDGHTKLVDFGIAKAALSSTETEVGVLKGKVAYMSPEQAMGGPIDARADLFAMGIVLWELIARQRLMSGESAANTLHKLMNEPIPRLSQVMTSPVDPTLDVIVARALEKDPGLRWQSAAEMRDALETWLASQPRPMRQDEVGRAMQHLFLNVREEVQRQIQRHMAAITAATNTQELQALTAESLHRMEQSGANVSGELLRLGQGSGSGSGVIPNYRQGSVPTGGYPGFAPQSSQSSQVTPPAKPGNNALLIVVTVGCFMLAALLIVVIGIRDRRAKEADLQAPAAVPTPVEMGRVDAPPAVVEMPALAPPGLPETVPSPEAAETPSEVTETPREKPTATARSKPPPRPQPPPRVTSAPPSPPPAAQDDPGFVTLFSYPWAKVTEGGRTVCAATPCTKVAMPPGSHTLVFENSEKGLKQSVQVSVKSGEETKKTVGLQ
jgi:eukaryotic-like serine/threonine-protein kinase